MATSITESPAWVNRMRAYFVSIDADKNRRVSNDDMAITAKKLAEHRKEGKEAEKRYFDTLKSIVSYGIQGRADGVNEDEFVEGMKKFVALPDARERMHAYAVVAFGVVDYKKKGKLTLDDYLQFHKASDTQFDEEMLKRVFKEADTDGNGLIDQKDFEASLVKFFLSA